MSKVTEAKQHYNAALKALKTSLFKWAPEYDIAADEFDKAGLAYKIAKKYTEAVDAYRKAAECHANPKCSSTAFHAGKSLEAAASCAQSNKDFKQSVTLIKSAAAYYRLTGKNGVACSVLEKAAQQCDQSADFRAAAEIWQEIVELFEEEGKMRQCKRPLERAISSAIRARNFDLANELFGVFTTTDSGERYFSTDLLEGGSNKATFMRFNGFGSSEEGKITSRLMEAIESGDTDILESIKRDQTFTFLLPEVSAIVRSLNVSTSESRHLEELQPVNTVPSTDRAALFATSSSSKSSSSNHQATIDAPPSYDESIRNDDKIRDTLEKMSLKSNDNMDQTDNTASDGNFNHEIGKDTSSTSAEKENLANDENPIQKTQAEDITEELNEDDDNDDDDIL